jgi:hypothetical protein
MKEESQEKNKDADRDGAEMLSYSISVLGSRVASGGQRVVFPPFLRSDCNHQRGRTVEALDDHPDA